MAVPSARAWRRGPESGDALRQAEESIRLNPRGPWRGGFETELRRQLEAVEHAAVTVRGLARSLADSAGLAEDDSPIRNRNIGIRLGAAIAEIAAALEAYGRLVLALGTPSYGPTESDLRYRLGLAHERQNQLNELLGTGPAERPPAGRCAARSPAISTGSSTELEAGSMLSTQPRVQRGLRRYLAGSPRARRQEGRRARASTGRHF